jgi:hypothetical protein
VRHSKHRPRTAAAAAEVRSGRGGDVAREQAVVVIERPRSAPTDRQGASAVR